MEEMEKTNGVSDAKWYILHRVFVFEAVGRTQQFARLHFRYSSTRRRGNSRA